MARPTNGDSDEMISAINITPLVDVVLVLLVVQMVTASYLASHAIPVDLPKGATGEATNTILGVSVTRDGAVFLDGTRVDDAAFLARVHQVHGADADARAAIAADGATAHRDVVHVIDLLRREHVTRFALNVDPEVVPHEPR
jgi:biopolymer transport protein ExbD